MEYREHPPRHSLRACVECIWTLRGRGDGREPASRILPDGCMEIVLNFADRFTRHHTESGPERQPALMLVGQMTNWIEISPGRTVDLIGIRFRPGGAAGFMAVPADVCTGGTFDIGDVMPALTDVADRAADARTAERIAIVQRALEASRQPAKSGELAVAVAVRRILGAWGNINVGRLASGLGVHERTLERHFTGQVGISPKMLARITRFQHVFRAVESGDDGWAAIATRCGYYDQSHLLRDFRAFAGQSPAVLVSREIPLTRAFLRTRRLSDISYTAG